MSVLPFLLPLLGGLTLGLGALWLLYSLGRIAGISGIAWGALAGSRSRLALAFSRRPFERRRSHTLAL
jgi:hypothetical protein